MEDYGTRAREKVEKQIETRLVRTYTEAQKDILRKLDGFVKQHKERDKVMRQRRDDGQISEDDYKNWLARQVFIGAQWEEKVKDITDTLTEIRGDDLKMIHDRQVDVFATNANYQAYKLEKDIGKSFRFDIYDKKAVENLIREKPALLPKKIVDKKKHNHWNQGIIANCITQGIIQGESIPKIARRIANTTANQNLTASTLYARTAMTCAQNAGRMQTLRESKEDGINVKKKWLATLDSRTRDSHRHLDGQVVDIEKPFRSAFGKIMFPGDPAAHPGDVYNCRCTLVYEYPEYEDEPSERIAYDEWIDEKGEHRESFLLNPNATFGDWLEEKKVRQEKRNKEAEKKKSEDDDNKKSRKFEDDIDAVDGDIKTYLIDAYENHRKTNGLTSTPYDPDSSLQFIHADLDNLSAETQKDLYDTLSLLIKKYDTNLIDIRTMDRQEAIMNQNTFASVFSDYSTDVSRMVINPLKCKNKEQMIEKLKKLRDKGYMPNIPDDKLYQFVYTHEFGHTLLGMDEPLKDKTNFVHVDYEKIRKLRKQVNQIYDEYKKTIAKIEEKRRNAELKFITDSDVKAGEEALQLSRELKKQRISLNSLKDADEFIADSFALTELEGEKNEWANKIKKIIDSNFRR